MIRRITLNASLTALALALAYIEHLLPVSSIIALPGIKLGLANTVGLLLIMNKKTADAFIVTALRCTLFAVLFTNPVSFYISVASALFAVFAMRLCSFVTRFGLSFVSVSVIGSAAFNFMQICTASTVHGAAVFYYLPFLLLFSVFSGAASGIIAAVLQKRLKKTGQE